MSRSINAVLTPPAVFLKGAPTELLQRFHFNEPVPHVVENQITWQWFKSHAYRHCLDPRLPNQNNSITDDPRMMRRLRNFRQADELDRCKPAEIRRLERLETSERWTQFGSGYWPEIRHWLVEQGYELNLDDRRPDPEKLALKRNEDFFEDLTEASQQMATRWLSTSMAWAQARDPYLDAACLALLCRKQSLVIVMATGKKVLEAFVQKIMPAELSLFRWWGDPKAPLSSEFIYMALPSMGIPLHCKFPITLIALGAERLVNHQLFHDFFQLNRMFRQYGVVNTSSSLSGSDALKLKICFGMFLDLEEPPLPFFRQHVHSASLSCAIRQDTEGNDLLSWKRREIWGNLPRNRSIASLANALDGVEHALDPGTILPGLRNILVSRALSKNTIIIVENREHGSALQALLPNYCLVTLDNVNRQGHMTVVRDAPVSGAIVTFAAYDELQTICGDLVIRVDGGTLSLDLSKIYFPVPFQERSQIVIQIAEPKNYGLRKYRQ